jgi:hypothetical protein
MRTLNKELKSEKKESKIKKFAFNSMKKAKEGLMIVTISAVMCVGFTNKIYGDENMGDDGKGGLVQVEPPKEQQNTQVPVRMEDQQWLSGIKIFQELKDNLSINAVSKTDLNLDNFKIFLGDRKPSEIIASNKDRYLELGLQENEVDRIIEIAQNYDANFDKENKINMRNRDGTTMALIMYFTLLSEEHGELGKSVINSGNIRLAAIFNKDEIKELNDYASAMSTHRINKEKNFPTVFKQSDDEEKVKTEIPHVEDRVKSDEGPVKVDGVIDLKDGYSSDPTEAAERAEVVDRNGKIDVGNLTEEQYNSVIREAEKRRGQREESIQEAEKTGQDTSQDQGELDSLNEFIEELEDKWNKAQKIKDGKIYGGQFGGGLRLTGSFEVYGSTNSQLSLLVGGNANVVFDWDTINKAKYNTFGFGGFVGLHGTLFEVTKDTNLYTQATVHGGVNLEKQFSFSLSQRVGIITNKHDLYLTGEQIFGENQYLIGMGYTSPFGLGVEFQYNITREEFIPEVHYLGKWFEAGASTKIPLTSNYLPKATVRATVRFGLTFIDLPNFKGNFNFFFTVEEKEVKEKEGYSPIIFNPEGRGFSGFK